MIAKNVLTASIQREKETRRRLITNRMIIIKKTGGSLFVFFAFLLKEKLRAKWETFKLKIDYTKWDG